MDNKIEINGKNPSDFEMLRTDKSLHIEPEIRDGKFTKFSICKDQADSQKEEEETNNETD